MRVAKWGNSLAVRLPSELVKQLGLREGDEVEIDAARKEYWSMTRDQRREEAIARMKASNWKLPSDWKFDRDDANSRAPD